MIRLQGVTKRFPGAAGEALAGVDLEIGSGEIFGIIGASGAGKSSLLRLLNALERPTGGSIKVDGIDVSGLGGRALRQLRRRIGMIFQGFGLHSSLTVEDNVAFPLRLASTGTAERQARVAHLLERVGLADQAAKYPAQLSGGQKQRVGIARALATGPAVLLCDEPTSALDPDTTRSVLRLLRELNRELGLTIVLITHEMDVVREVCDRVAVIDAGRIVEVGTAADLFLAGDHPATRRLIAGEQDGRPASLPAGTVLVRLTRRGDEAERPVAAGEVVEGRIGRIGNERYSQLLLAIRPDEIGRIEGLGRVERL